MICGAAAGVMWGHRRRRRRRRGACSRRWTRLALWGTHHRPPLALLVTLCTVTYELASQRPQRLRHLAPAASSMQAPQYCWKPPLRSKKLMASCSVEAQGAGAAGLGGDLDRNAEAADGRRTPVPLAAPPTTPYPQPGPIPGRARGLACRQRGLLPHAAGVHGVRDHHDLEAPRAAGQCRGRIEGAAG